MRVRSEGQMDWMEFYFWDCGRTSGTARHYLFHLSDVFCSMMTIGAIKLFAGWLWPLILWFLSSLRCSGLFTHRLSGASWFKGSRLSPEPTLGPHLPLPACSDVLHLRCWRIITITFALWVGGPAPKWRLSKPRLANVSNEMTYSGG